MTKAGSTREIERIAITNGIDLVGVADLRNIEGLRTYPKDLSRVLQKEKCNEWLERKKSPVPSYCWEYVLACPKGSKRSHKRG